MGAGWCHSPLPLSRGVVPKYNVATKIKLSAWCVGNCLVVRCKENAHKQTKRWKSTKQTEDDFGQTQKRQRHNTHRERKTQRERESWRESQENSAASLSLCALSSSGNSRANACAVSSTYFSCCF